MRKTTHELKHWYKDSLSQNSNFQSLTIVSYPDNRDGIIGGSGYGEFFAKEKPNPHLRYPRREFRNLNLSPISALSISGDWTSVVWRRHRRRMSSILGSWRKCTVQIPSSKLQSWEWLAVSNVWHPFISSGETLYDTVRGLRRALPLGSHVFDSGNGRNDGSMSEEKRHDYRRSIVEVAAWRDPGCGCMCGVDGMMGSDTVWYVCVRLKGQPPTLLRGLLDRQRRPSWEFWKHREWCSSSLSKFGVWRKRDRNFSKISSQQCLWSSKNYFETKSFLTRI